jgi:hypothetical protein
MIIALEYVVSAFDQTVVTEDRSLQTRARLRVARPVRTPIVKMKSGCPAPVPGQFLKLYAGSIIHRHD